ncbi:MAG: LPS assembly lipoprotein LptE [Chitinophagales bacterium]|nr:LPS assembly lipoprotein LptE [Chitinophagales bacterium]
MASKKQKIIEGSINLKWAHSFYKLSAFSFFILTLYSCGIYSFTGASIDPSVKTFNVHFIQNQAPVVVPSLSQTITEALKNKFLTSTNLQLVQSGGDIEFSGTITNYSVTPVSAQANETAALNRLTITVSIDYVNHNNEKQNFSSSFSRYSDYNSSTDLTSIQDQLIKEINDQLTEDIFNKAFVNW